MPSCGLVFLLLAAVRVALFLYGWDGVLGPAVGVSLLMTLGIVLFGAAIRLPEGTARRWLVRAWLATILAFGAMLFLGPLVAGP